MPLIVPVDWESDSCRGLCNFPESGLGCSVWLIKFCCDRAGAQKAQIMMQIDSQTYVQWAQKIRTAKI